MSPLVQNFGCHLIFPFFLLSWTIPNKRQQAHLKCCYLYTNLHSSTSLITKTFISTVVHIKSGRVQMKMTHSSIKKKMGKNYVSLSNVPHDVKTKVTIPKHIKTTIFQAQHICLSYKSGERTTPSVLSNTTLCPILDKITIYK
jgi:hypothetical protein